MRCRNVMGASFAAALLIGSVLAEDAPKSGPQVGDKIPGPFNVLNVNGAQAGKSNCQV